MVMTFFEHADMSPPEFGGEFKATLEYPTMAACERTARELIAYTVKHKVLQPCTQQAVPPPPTVKE